MSCFFLVQILCWSRLIICSSVLIWFLINTLSSVSVIFVVNASFLIMLLLFHGISSSQNLITLSLLFSLLVLLYLFEDLNLNNNVLISLLFACESSIDMNKHELLSSLIFLIRKYLNLGTFALDCNLFYLASFLSNKFLNKMIWNENLKGLLLLELQLVIEQSQELENKLLNVLEHSFDANYLLILLELLYIKILINCFHFQT